MEMIGEDVLDGTKFEIVGDNVIKIEDEYWDLDTNEQLVRDKEIKGPEKR